MDTAAMTAEALAGGLAPHPDQLALDAEGRLGRDLACAGCGYNLRGALSTAGCPECGTAVALSLRGDLLRYSDPAWVRGLARGVALLLAAIGAAVAGGGLGPVSAGVAGAAGGQVAGALVQMIFGLAAVGLGGAGAWLVTERDPGQRGVDEGLTWRPIARWGVLAGFALQLVAGGAIYFLPVLGDAVFAIGTLGGMGGGLLLLIGFATLLAHLRKLALRIPSRGLALQTRIVIWGHLALLSLLALALVGVAIGFMMAFAGGPAGEMMIVGGAIVGCGGALLLAVFGIWLVVLLVMYLVRFRDASTGVSA